MEGDDVFLEKKETTRFVLRKSTRAIILLLLYLSVAVLSMTMAIFKAASVPIRNALLISNSTYEILTFVFHLGEFISTVSLMLLMRKADRKDTVLFSLFTAALLLMLFQFTESQMILMPAYFFLGFDVMAMNIYIILWIDQFAAFKYKTAFLSITNIFKALGVNLGLLLNYYFTGEKYKSTFLVEMFSLFALGFVFVPFSKTYFSSNILLYKGKNTDQEYSWKGKTQKEGEVEETEYGDNDSIYRNRHSGGSTNEWNILYIIFCFMKNKVYMSGWFASIFLSISTAGFNSWVFGFFNEQNGNKSVYEQLLSKAGLSMTGPVVGSVIILLLSFFVGNYHHRSTPVLMFVFYLLTAVCGNVIPCAQTNNLKIICSYLFFIGSSAQLPYLQGVNLSGGTPSRKPFGVILANAGGLFLGTIPGPKVYAYCLENYSREDTLKIFMRVLLVGLVCDFSMMYHKCKTYPPRPEEKKEVELSEKV